MAAAVGFVRECFEFMMMKVFLIWARMSDDEFEYVPCDAQNVVCDIHLQTANRAGAHPHSFVS